ncbi:hypothetical protein [Spiroplasma sp. AdecLV25b]|uniref:hypothetical protein n=1 Tax=Spiroplasma sp. AdecLV25b TaxID=3027162 RepID=UPI0027E0B0CB|nr:hypothetical protein [Spiroplasma sp. AdecLV25b]
MNENVLKILRYNTGNDKKVFLEFKDFFDITIINANIVVHSSSAIANLLSIHKKEYIIDPQTHIFQYDSAQIISKKQVKLKRQLISFYLKCLKT